MLLLIQCSLMAAVTEFYVKLLARERRLIINGHSYRNLLHLFPAFTLSFQSSICLHPAWWLYLFHGNSFHTCPNSSHCLWSAPKSNPSCQLQSQYSSYSTNSFTQTPFNSPLVPTQDDFQHLTPAVGPTSHDGPTHIPLVITYCFLAVFLVCPGCARPLHLAHDLAFGFSFTNTLCLMSLYTCSRIEFLWWLQLEVQCISSAGLA